MTASAQKKKDKQAAATAPAAQDTPAPVPAAKPPVYIAYHTPLIPGGQTSAARPIGAVTALDDGETLMLPLPLVPAGGGPIILRPPTKTGSAPETLNITPVANQVPVLIALAAMPAPKGQPVHLIPIGEAVAIGDDGSLMLNLHLVSTKGGPVFLRKPQVKKTA